MTALFRRTERPSNPAPNPSFSFIASFMASFMARTRAKLRPNFRGHLSTLAVAASALGSSAAAQVSLSGPISDALNGPLLSGTVYEVTGTIEVAQGTTQTIQPGAILKFNFDGIFAVRGTLLANGTGRGSIICTDSRDDSAGGDTNNDGATTTAAPGWWRGLQFFDGSSGSQVNGITTRYAGRFGAAFRLANCDAQFTDCTAFQSSSQGFDLSNSSFPILANCNATGCASQAFHEAPLAAVPNFTGLTASGNGLDQLRVTRGTLLPGTSVSISADNLLGSTMFMAQPIIVPAAASLAFGPGCIVKPAFDGNFTVNGTLHLAGTAANPVIITSERDDTAGGDTNGDGGTTVPADGWWRGLQLQPGSDASVIEHAELRFGGRFSSALELRGTSPTVRDCHILSCTGTGVDLNSDSTPTVENLTVQDCTGQGIGAAPIQALPGFSGLQFTGNAFDRVEISSATVGAAETITIDATNGHLSTFFLNTGLFVDVGGQLTFGEGVIVKMGFDSLWTIDGNLHLNGTGTRPVALTSERDDSIGGDTNGDGNATLPTPGWWRGLALRDNSDGSILRFAHILYAGRFQAPVEVNSSAFTMHRCRVEDCTSFGLDLNNNEEPCSIEANRFERCGSAAISGVRLDRLPDILRTVGQDNGRNTIEVTQAALSANTTIEPLNQLDGSVALLSNINIPAGLELNLQSGVIFKMGFDRLVTAQGRLSVRASHDNPVIFTELRDDSIGGDANGGGLVTSGTPGSWRGLTFPEDSDGSIVLGLDIRYAGRFQPAVLCRSDATVLRDVRSAHSSGLGFQFTRHLISLEGLVAYDCALDGISLLGGTFDVRRCTCVDNSGFGIRAGGSFGGSVSDSILKFNIQGPENGLGAGRVRYSNGPLAGTGGNIDAAPLFVDRPAGDLRLLAGSPSIDTGDPGSPLDPDSTRADMGAYFFNSCAPEVICTQPAAFAPCTPALSLMGFASLTSPAPFVITLANAPTQSFALFFYGVGAPTTVGAPFGDICVAAPYVRSGAFPSGGSFADGPCAGRFEFDFNAFLQTGGAPGVSAGDNVIGHFWYRDPSSPLGAVFSGGVQIPVCP